MIFGQYEEDLTDRIIEVTGSDKSLGFYKKAISLLGSGRVEEELSELKYQMKKGGIRCPAGYLNALLRDRIGHSTPQTKTPHLEPQQSMVLTHFNQNQSDLITELKPRKIKENENGSQRRIPIPYSDKYLPWATIMGPEFFTLSTNRSKSDKVIAKLRTLDGKFSMIPMIRGCLFPGDSERGIPTVEHARILGAIEIIWVQQGCKYTLYENGAITCHCNVSIRELSRLLGWESFGGRDLRHLKRKIVDLSVMPYYLFLEEIDEFKSLGFKGFGFKLIGDVKLIEMDKYNAEETTIDVIFSDTFSRQLLERRTVSKPKEILLHRSELTFLARLYLEPILMSKNGDTYTIQLKHLIQALALPPAKWHAEKKKRKRHFLRVSSELNGKNVKNGRTFNTEIIQGLDQDDYLFVSRLVQPDAPK